MGHGHRRATAAHHRPHGHDGQRRVVPRLHPPRHRLKPRRAAGRRRGRAEPRGRGARHCPRLDTATGEQLQHITDHTDTLLSVTWSPDAARLAAASADGSVRVWNAATGEQSPPHRPHRRNAPRRAVGHRPPRHHHERRQLLSAWVYATGGHLAYFRHTSEVRSVAWSPHAARLAAASGDGSARIWDAATGEQLNHISGNADWVSSVAWSPDSARLATTSAPGSVRIWDAATGEQLHQITGHTSRVSSVAWRPTDDTRLATASADASVREPGRRRPAGNPRSRRTSSRAASTRS